MNRNLLIDSLVRQTTVLMAALATSGGRRAPLAHIAHEVFLQLSQEIEAQGVSRKVTADMFGLALRSYQRRIQRSEESGSERGMSLWQGVIHLLTQRPEITRSEILDHFRNDDQASVRGVLHDLRESGLVVAKGPAGHETFRYQPRDDFSPADDDVDDLLCAIIFRDGPLSIDDLVERTRLNADELKLILTRLVMSERITVSDGDAPEYSARKFLVPFESDAGWEASVFDHYSALVRTICAKLNQGPRAQSDDQTGGSTFSMEVWEGHPLYEKVTGSLERMRKELVELRREVSEYNAEQKLPEGRSSVVTYVGQSILTDSSDSES